MFKMFDHQAASLAIRERGLTLGNPLHWSKQTTSTNEDAALAANAGAAHGTLFLAEEQTHGRGRLGRRWLSAPGTSLLFSLVLRPTMPPERLSSISLAIGLAVADSVGTVVDNSRVGLKWPNDILIGEKKTAGILIEGALVSGRCEYVVVGIGLNVLQRTFDPSIQARATSLILEANKKPSRHRMLIELLHRIEERVQAFDVDGLRSMKDDLDARDVTRGCHVRLGNAYGLAEGIDEDGRLRVRVGGEVRFFHAGEVQIVAA